MPIGFSLFPQTILLSMLIQILIQRPIWISLSHHNLGSHNIFPTKYPSRLRDPLHPSTVLMGDPYFEVLPMCAQKEKSLMYAIGEPHLASICGFSSIYEQQNSTGKGSYISHLLYLPTTINFSSKYTTPSLNQNFSAYTQSSSGL